MSSWPTLDLLRAGAECRVGRSAGLVVVQASLVGAGVAGLGDDGLQVEDHVAISFGQRDADARKALPQ